MFRSVLFVFVFLFSTWQAAASAQWQLPEGVKSLTVNGYPMAFLDRGTGQTVVLVHGGAGHDYRVWAQLTASPPSGLRLVAVSLRHLYPERWDGKGDRFSIKQHAEDLAALIEALGVGPIYLVAHSRGGVVAFWAARARPDLVKKLVLMEPDSSSWLPVKTFTPAQDSGSIRELRSAVVARFEQGDIDGGLEAWIDRAAPGSWRGRSEVSRQWSRDNAWTLLGASGPPDTPVLCADVAGLKMPVLLMQGEKTTSRLSNTVEDTHKCLASAERVTIPDTGHSMHLQNPAAFRVELTKFLSK